ncbi:MAG: ribonuclease P protein component [Chitinophagaceae bacterium]
MAKQFTLGKKERLKSRKTIEQLFTGGKSFAVNPFRVYYLFDTTAVASLQFGAGVSSKHFKKAVDRNRVKRLMKEAWRLQKNPLSTLIKEQNKHLSVFFIYTGKELPDYKDVHEKTGKIISDKLCKMIHTPK